MMLKDKILDRAQKYMLKGNFDKALAEYRSAVDVDPRDVSIRLRIGDLYAKTNSLPEAIKEYTEVARANAQRGFYPKAIAVYKKILKLDDSILDVHYKLAELYTKQRLIADAISSYSYIVSTFEKKGKTSEVMELLKKMLDIDPDNVGIRLKLADLFLKLSFEKDAVTEYAQIFAKLIAEGKIDRAEKVFLSLYNARPNEPVILNALAQIYKSKGDEVKFLNYARPLLKTYTKSEDIGGALALCKSILSVFPDDAAALEVMRGIEPPELIHQEPAGTAASQSPVPETTGQGQSSESDFSVAASQASGEEAGEVSGEAEDAGEAPLISWPEDDIEISVEGFDEEQAVSVEPIEDAFKEEQEFVVTGSEGHVPEVSNAEEPAQVEVPAPAEGSFIEEEVPVEAAAEEVLEAEEAFATEKSPAEELILIEEPAPVEEAVEAVSNKDEEEAEVEIDLGDYGIDRSIALASVEETVAEEKAPVEVAAEEVLATEEELAVEEPFQIEEPAQAEEPIDIEEPASIEEPVAEEEAPAEVAAEEVLAIEEELAVEEPFQIEEPTPVEEPVFEEEAPVEVAAEDAVEAMAEEAVEATAEEAVKIEEEQAVEETPIEAVEEPIDIEEPAPVEEPVAEEPTPVEEPVFVEDAPVEATAEEVLATEEELAVEEPIQIEEPFETIEAEPTESIEEAIERVLSSEPFVADVEDVPEREMEAASEADAPAVVEDIGLGVESAPAPEAAESAAESMESIELDDELSSAIEEIQARMESDDMLLEPEKVKIEESAPESEFIDLSAELGMEEALEGLAGTWTQNEGESTDAFDEYKDGMGLQLSREDTETHYNLGIAYMEMELFDEASKEFKIALKEPRLEGDCYARLGLCAMAESKPDEAVMFYLKGLKVEGKSEDERKGMMYELALAYEAAGDTDEAFQLFTSINDLDPDYREVVEKLSGFERGRPYIPSDDGLIEVELL